MAFDEQAFRKAAAAEGYTDSEINAHVQQMTGKPTAPAGSAAPFTAPPQGFGNYVKDESAVAQKGVDVKKQEDAGPMGLPSWLMPALGGAGAAGLAYGAKKAFGALASPQPVNPADRIDPTISPISQEVQSQALAPAPAAPTGPSPEEVRAQQLHDEKLRQIQEKHAMDMQLKQAKLDATTAKPAAAVAPTTPTAPVPSTAPAAPPTVADIQAKTAEAMAANAAKSPVVPPTAVPAVVNATVADATPTIANPAFENPKAPTAPEPVVGVTAAPEVGAAPVAPKSKVAPMAPPEGMNLQYRKNAKNPIGPGAYNWLAGQEGPKAAEVWKNLVGEKNMSYDEFMKSKKLVYEGYIGGYGEPDPFKQVAKPGEYVKPSTIPKSIKGAISPKLLGSLNTASMLMAPSTAQAPTIYSGGGMQGGRGYVNPPNIDPNIPDSYDKLGEFFQKLFGDKIPYPHKGSEDKFLGMRSK